jgi:hypothetical protein
VVLWCGTALVGGSDASGIENRTRSHAIDVVDWLAVGNDLSLTLSSFLSTISLSIEAWDWIDNSEMQYSKRRTIAGNLAVGEIGASGQIAYSWLSALFRL